MSRFGTAPDYHTPFASYRNGDELRQQLSSINGDIQSCSFSFAELCSILEKTHDEGLNLGVTERDMYSGDCYFVAHNIHERAVGSLRNDGFVAVVDDGVNFRQALHDLKVELIDYFHDLGFEPEHGPNGLMNPLDNLTFIRVAKE